MFHKKLALVILSLFLASCDLHKEKYLPTDNLILEEKENIIINFSSDNYKFRDDQKDILDKKVLSELKSDPSLNLSVSGYANDKKSPISDADLASTRAEYIKEYLVKNGIAAKRIKTKGYGIAYTPKDEKITTLNGKVAVIKFIK